MFKSIFQLRPEIKKVSDIIKNGENTNLDIALCAFSSKLETRYGSINISSREHNLLTKSFEIIHKKTDKKNKKLF